MDAWTEEHDKAMSEDAKQVVKNIVDGLGQRDHESNVGDSFKTLLQLLDESDLQMLLKEYDLELPPTSAFWRQYMNMVSTLLQFI